MLQIPVLGWCLRSFAIARFSWSFALTQQAGMSIEPSLVASFKATSNGAFLKASPHVWAAVREGETLHSALEETQLFPIDYLHIIDVAETTGTVPETLERISPELEGQARLGDGHAGLSGGLVDLVPGGHVHRVPDLPRRDVLHRPA